MNARGEENEGYTGLLLLSGEDAPGITSSLFSTLEPFSITILDIEQLIIRSRLILTVLIELDPAHGQAIEDDLNQIAMELGVDIAMSFGVQSLESIQEKSGLFSFRVSSEKITPGLIAQFAKDIVSNGGNIERIRRLETDPRTVVELQVSGANTEKIADGLKTCADKLGADFQLIEKG